MLGGVCAWCIGLGFGAPWWSICLVEHMLGDACVMQEGVHTNLAEFSSLIGPFRIPKKKK